MKILVGCEESQVVCREFRKAGHDAWSCDLEPTRGNPKYHHQQDIMEVIPTKYWDLVILHPDCTNMAVCNNRLCAKGKPRHHERLRDVEWTIELWNLAKKHSNSVTLENPASVIFPHLRKIGAVVQYIQPWMFGHKEYKKTGLALHNLPKLEPNDNWREVKTFTDLAPKKESERIWRMTPSTTRKRDRSETYLGIAKAFVEQWGRL